MKTHQLATLLDSLRAGFGEALKKDTSDEFVEAAAFFRELPNQSLKDMLKGFRKANTSQTPAPGATTLASPGVSTVIERIREIRSGTAPAADSIDLGRLTNPQLKDVLKAFNQPVSGAKTDLVTRIRQLCVLIPTPVTPPPTPTAPGALAQDAAELDTVRVDEGVRIFTELRDNKTLTIADVRAGFERLREYPKPVVEEISRRLKYTPFGSRTEILDRLLANLEAIKMSQYRMDQILTGT